VTGEKFAIIFSPSLREGIVMKKGKKRKRRDEEKQYTRGSEYSCNQR
jgi:hypothetical protein